MKNRLNRTDIFFICLLFAFYLSVLLFVSLKVLHLESATFIYNYLASRPLSNIIFDPLRNDWGFYQARELSYFIDYLDANFIAVCAEYRVGHFYTLSFSLIILLIIVIGQYFGNLLFRNMSKLEIFAGTCLLISTPDFLLNTSFFRSAKPLCTLFICLICYLTLLLYYRGMVFSKQNNKLIIATIAIIELFMILSDRQGVFFVAALSVITAVFLMFSFRLPELSPANRYSLFKLASVSASVLVFAALYNGLICPWIIFALNGYFPSFSFQNLQPVNINSALDGIMAFFRYVGVILGIGGVWGGIIVIAAIFILLLLPLRKHVGDWSMRSNQQQVYFLCAFILLIAMMVAMFVLMTARHSSLASLPELVSGTYSMPTLALVVFFVMLALNCLQRRKSKVVKNLITALIFLITLVNLILLPHYLNMQRQGHLKRNYEITPQILKNINAEADKDEDLRLLLPTEIMLIKRLRREQQTL